MEKLSNIILMIWIIHLAGFLFRKIVRGQFVQSI